MMEKYATYRVFKNTRTQEIKRLLLTDEEELEKTASSDEWIEIFEDEDETAIPDRN